MSRRAPRWTATSIPALTRGMSAVVEQEADRLQDLRRRAAAINAATIEAEFGSLIDQYHALSDACDHAERYWVSSDMAAVALDAASDVPQLRAEDAPSQAGFIAFAAPMPDFPTDTIGGLALRDDHRTDIPYTDPVPVDGLLWRLDNTTVTIWLVCRDQRLPLPLLGTPSLGLTPFMRLQATMPAQFDTRFTALGSDGVAVNDPAHLGPLALLSACWVLMATPTVAEHRHLDGHWGGRATPSTQPDHLVTTIDLRPLRTIDTTTNSGRKLTVRHLVRGHWTHQAYGPHHSQRRLQWIAPYIKGPADAPLIHTERVWIWRRT